MRKSITQISRRYKKKRNAALVRAASRRENALWNPTCCPPRDVPPAANFVSLRNIARENCTVRQRDLNLGATKLRHTTITDWRINPIFLDKCVYPRKAQFRCTHSESVCTFVRENLRKYIVFVVRISLKFYQTCDLTTLS